MTRQRAFHCQSPDHEGNRLVPLIFDQFELREEVIRADHSGGRLGVRMKLLLCKACGLREIGKAHKSPPGQEVLLS